MAGQWKGRRILVGGLAWQTDDGKLEDAFRRFGRVVDAQVIVDRESGRSRGFGFVTFESQRATDNAIREMHYQELDNCIIEVYNAETWMNTRRNGGDTRHGNGGGGHYCDARGGARRPSNCFACGRPGHWARDCHNAGGDHCQTGGFSPRFSRDDRGYRLSGSHSFEYRCYMNNGCSGGRHCRGYQVDNNGRYATHHGHHTNNQFYSGVSRGGTNMYERGSCAFAQSGYRRARGKSCDAQSGGYSRGRARGRSCDAQSGGYSRARGRSCEAKTGYGKARGRSCHRNEVFVSFKVHFSL